MRVSQRSLSADRHAKPLRGIFFAAPLLCAKKEERAEKQEAKVPFVVEFLCVSASLRAKKEKAEKQETRSLSADRQARPDERLDFFAPAYRRP